MQAPSDCGIPSEAELQRACGTLYITHGLESTCGLLLFVFFSIVAVKLHARNHLNSPGLAFVKFMMFHTYEFIDEYITTLYTVGQMDELKLEQRLRFCSNVDKMCNAASALLSLLGITRWLSIGNVNGMRYIGYAITCPMMQVELVAMLGPWVPCFRLCALTSFLITFMTLSCGYAASLLEMPVWEGNLMTFLSTGNWDDFGATQKFAVVAPAFCGISFLWTVTLPYLVIVYTCAGGGGNEDLPQEYRALVAIVWLTWLGFPAWWLLSWEGNAVITDTKFNEIGFTVLNMLAKGLFTLQGFRVGELADQRKAALRRKRGRDGSLESHDSVLEDINNMVPPIISRKSSKNLEKSKFVKVLRRYDQDEWDSDSDEDNEWCGDEDDYGYTSSRRGGGAGSPRMDVYSPRKGEIYSPCKDGAGIDLYSPKKPGRDSQRTQPSHPNQRHSNQGRGQSGGNRRSGRCEEAPRDEWVIQTDVHGLHRGQQDNDRGYY